jgi:predicted DsbA family dithiol-disulfide isomerase
MATPLEIQIVSDPVCPWCYIGKRRLEQALAARPGLPVTITWLPFQLSPDLPREGRDRAEHYATIFGPERAAEIMAGMQQTALEEGLRFRSGPGARSPNTLSAHVLMHWAGQAGVDQGAVAEKLFDAHHAAVKDIGDPELLARIAGEVGMDAEDVLAKLRAGIDEDVVRAQIGEARQAGVTGVPFFIFNRRYGVSGAQPAEALLEVIDRLQAGEAPG